MNPLLIVIPFTAGNAPVAERLCDWIFELAYRKQYGHVLLICGEEVHAEMRTKILVAAEVAFQTAEIAVMAMAEPLQPLALSNKLFQFAADYVSKHYRCPWLWLEPEAVPLKPDWQEELSVLYYEQPKRYLGGHLKIGDGLALGRVAVYPQGATSDYARFVDGEMPFWMAAASTVVTRSTKTRLIQQGVFDVEKGLAQIRPESIIYHTDPTGTLIEMLRTENSKSKPRVEIQAEETTAPKRRGRPPKATSEPAPEPSTEPVFT